MRKHLRNFNLGNRNMSTNITDLPYNPPNPTLSGQPAPQQQPQPQQQAPVRLPERDIPRETIQHTIDPQTQVQYLPARPQEYIPAAPAPLQNKMDYSKLIEEFRFPIMISLMYFIFQTQSFQTLFKKIIPGLFSESGSLTSNGVLVKSGLFGSAFYALTLVMEHLIRQ